MTRQIPSVLKAKQAISNYNKAVGDPAGLAGLEQALIIATDLPAGGRDALVARMDRVRAIGHKCGYGAGDGMDSILAKHAQRSVRQSKRR